MQKVSADRIFTGTEWLVEHIILAEGGQIQGVVPKSKVDSTEIKYFHDCLIVPAFVDVQVYGASKKLLATFPEPETLALMYEQFNSEGTCVFLPTLATNTVDVFKKSIDAVRQYWKQNGKGVYGLHLEGPWINEAKRGAHIKEWIHSPNIEEVKDLLEYGRGVIKMITIAPEVCTDAVIDLILSYEIILS